MMLLQLIQKFTNPITSNMELNISVCDKKKLERYEINIRKKIPYIPINPMSLSCDFKKY